jgi:EAL domain-containing protein (putative c-di-GMP-specific phosphodiesterase class I)
VNLAKALDMEVVAEDVETAKQSATLKSLGCDFVQGYYLVRPMNDESFAELLEKNF